jgi:hypothetical protein
VRPTAHGTAARDWIARVRRCRRWGSRKALTTPTAAELSGCRPAYGFVHRQPVTRA